MIAIRAPRPLSSRTKMRTSAVVTFRTQRGLLLTLRPAATGDLRGLAGFLEGLSAETLFLRYLAPIPRLDSEAARQEVRRLMDGSPADHPVAIVLDRAQQVVAVGELVRDAGDPAIAEVALVVADAYQRDGIGRALFADLLKLGLQRGIKTLRGVALTENLAVRRLFGSSGLRYTTTFGSGTIEFEAALDAA
ncbi:MAG TPA: GNAT family N-acetyltransferase [Roseiflexaceae bacterium]